MSDDNRIVKLESDVHHLQSDVTEIKEDVKCLRAMIEALRSEFPDIQGGGGKGVRVNSSFN